MFAYNPGFNSISMYSGNAQSDPLKNMKERKQEVEELLCDLYDILKGVAPSYKLDVGGLIAEKDLRAFEAIFLPLKKIKHTPAKTGRYDYLCWFGFVEYHLRRLLENMREDVIYSDHYKDLLWAQRDALIEIFEEGYERIKYHYDHLQN